MKYEWIETECGETYIRISAVKMLEVIGKSGYNVDKSDYVINRYVLAAHMVPECDYETIRTYRNEYDYTDLNNGDVLNAETAASRDLRTLVKLITSTDANTAIITMKDLGVFQKEIKT